ncbi:MAG: hypothetical protein AAGC55_27780, partial [Myxococcota bacterium]
DDMLGELVDKMNELYLNEHYREVWELVEQFLDKLPGCAMLWLWRAKLVFIGDIPGEPPTIKDIEECLWRAAMLAPDSPQPNVELGHHLVN